MLHVEVEYLREATETLIGCRRTLKNTYPYAFYLPKGLEKLLKAELRAMTAHADLVIVNGGLGPTIDDLTAEILDAVAGVPLVEHPAAVAFWAGGAIGITRSSAVTGAQQAHHHTGEAYEPPLEEKRAQPSHHGPRAAPRAFAPGFSQVDLSLARNRRRGLRMERHQTRLTTRVVGAQVNHFSGAFNLPL